MLKCYMFLKRPQDTTWRTRKDHKSVYTEPIQFGSVMYLAQQTHPNVYKANINLTTHTATVITKTPTI